MHPLAAIFAVLVGAEIGGIVGIYLAIPLIASMRVFWSVCAGEPALQTPHRQPDDLVQASSSLVEADIA